MPNAGLLTIFFTKSHIDSPKNPDLKRKFQVDTKLSKYSFPTNYHVHTWASVITKCSSEYTAYIYCNLAYEFLSLTELLYRRNMELFEFLTVIWQRLQ